jgi:hypothetical protein
VNTFLNKNGSPTVLPGEVIRSTKEEKEQQIQNLHAFWKRNEKKAKQPETVERSGCSKRQPVCRTDGNSEVLFAGTDHHALV